MIPILIFILFLVLKLTGVIAWSWLWVTAPLWIPVALAALIGVGSLLFGGGLIGLCAILAATFGGSTRRRK